jgi:ankyrin repeat protein
MPGKSKKGKGLPADDFDDIIAKAEQLNASIVTTSSRRSNESSSSRKTKTASSSSSSNSRSSSKTPPTDEDADKMMIKICIAGDVVQLRQYLGLGDRLINAGPLSYAAAYGKLEIVRCLVEDYGADINEKYEKYGDTPLFFAAQGGHLKVLRYLVKDLGVDVNQERDNGATSLFLAAQQGHVAVAECLVKELGASVNQAVEDGCTPLGIAAQVGIKDMVVCLVRDLGADINQANYDGGTPLMAASGMQHEKIVRYLLKNGANAQALYTNIGTAVDVSKLYGAPAKQTAYLEARTHCANRGCSGAGLKKCATCLEVFFCSKGCQVAAWPVHKADCKRRVEAKGGKGKRRCHAFDKMGSPLPRAKPRRCAAFENMCQSPLFFVALSTILVTCWFSCA